MMPTIRPDLPLVLNPEVVLGDIDGELVAFCVGAGNYLHLNSSGSFIFSLFDADTVHTPQWLYQQLGQEYAVDEAQCRQDVDPFLARCLELDLLRQPAR